MGNKLNLKHVPQFLARILLPSIEVFSLFGLFLDSERERGCVLFVLLHVDIEFS